MDPTAPDENDQNSLKPRATSPIQPGQFVVASDENAMNPPAAQSPIPPSAVSNPSTGPAGGFTASPYAPTNVQTQGPMSPPPQPDPTPFAPPPQSTNPAAMPPDGDSKFGKVKIIGIAAGAISLLVIIAALIWFFVIKGKTSQPPATTSQQIEESSPAATPATGFGQISESTPEASSQAQPASPQPPNAGTTPAQ